MVPNITVPSPPARFADILTAPPGAISAHDRQVIENAIAKMAKLKLSCAKNHSVESSEVLRALACLEQVGVRGWGVACEHHAARREEREEMEEVEILVSRLQVAVDALDDTPLVKEERALLTRLEALVTYLEWFIMQLESLIKEQEELNDVRNAALNHRHTLSDSDGGEQDTTTIGSFQLKNDHIVIWSREDEEQEVSGRADINETSLRGDASTTSPTPDDFPRLENPNPLLKDPLFLNLQAWIDFARSLQLQNASHAHTIDQLQEIVKDTEDDVVWQDQELSRAWNHIRDLNHQIETVKQERLDALREAERAKTEALMLHDQIMSINDQVANFCAELDEQERYMLALYPESSKFATQEPEGMRGGAQAEHYLTRDQSSGQAKAKSTRPVHRRSQVYKEVVTDPNLVRPVDESFYAALPLPPDSVDPMFPTGTGDDGRKHPQMVQLPAVEAHDPYTEYSTRRGDSDSPYVLVDEESEEPQTNKEEHGTSRTRSRPQTYSERYWSHNGNSRDSHQEVKSAFSPDVDLFPFKRKLVHQNFRGGAEELEWQHLQNERYDDATLGWRHVSPHVGVDPPMNNASHGKHSSRNTQKNRQSSTNKKPRKVQSRLQE